MRVVALCVASIVLAVGAFADPPEMSVAEVKTLRLQGQLAEAISIAERQIHSHPDDRLANIEYYLELARLYDRIGLHNNSRPVTGALENVDAAASLANPADTAALAEIELARAEFYYRAEMSEREFPKAFSYSRSANEQFQKLDDKHGKAEATHRLGLIHMQRNELDDAQIFFDRSLELDKAGGERVYFRGEYERHVGYVHYLRGDIETAIPYFQRSLAARIEAGMTDASMFAAITLASALVSTDRIEEAKPHALYAIKIAEQLNSPAGLARATPTLGQIYEHEGDLDAARKAYEAALGIAVNIGYDGTADRMKTALQRVETLATKNNH